MVQQSLQGRVVGEADVASKTVRFGIISVVILLFFFPSTIAGDGNGATHQQCFDNDPTFKSVKSEMSELSILQATSILLDLQPVYSRYYKGYVYDYGDCPLSQMVYHLASTGIEATYRSDDNNSCSKPRVLIEGSGTYEASGFRIVFPSAHTLQGTRFAAELQIFHSRIEDEKSEPWDDASSVPESYPPSFSVLSVLIDTNGTSNVTTLHSTQEDAVWKEMLVGLETAVYSHQELCKSTIVDAVAKDTRPEVQNTGVTFTTTAAIAVVGRGGDENFVEDPIRLRRKLHEFHEEDDDTIIANRTSKIPYDLFVFDSVEAGQYSSQHNYRYITTTATCSDLMLWSVEEETLKLAPEQLAKVTTLAALDYKDKDCQPSTNSSSKMPDFPFSSTNVTKLTQYNNFCCDNKKLLTSCDDDESVSEPTSSSFSSSTTTPTYSILIHAMISILFLSSVD